MAVLAGRTQRVLANGVYSGLAVAAALGALALGNALRHGLMAPMPAQTAVSASPRSTMPVVRVMRPWPGWMPGRFGMPGKGPRPRLRSCARSLP